jgi:hypothetical protein
MSRLQSHKPLLASFVYLPDLTTVHVESRQPTVVAAASVHANQITQVENLCLRCVSNNGDFSRTVQLLRDIISQGQPTNRVIVLLIKRHVWLVIGVKEDVCVRLEI